MAGMNMRKKRMKLVKDERGQWIISAGFLVSVSIIILALLLNQAMMGGYQSSGAILEFPKHEIRELVQETHREVIIAAVRANEKESMDAINLTFRNIMSNYSNSTEYLYAAHGQMVYMNVSSLTFTSDKISEVNVTILFSDGVTTCTFDPEVIEIPVPDTTPPAAVTDLAAIDPTSSSINLTWTAPGDDGNTGTATTYDIRYLTSTINDTNWDSATQCAGEPSPQPAGSSESFTVTGLNADTTYYFALKTSDEVPNESPLSNVTSNTTIEAPANAMHIASIDMTLKTTGLNVNAIALVTIVNATDAPVEGATVEGNWSNATFDTDSGLTDASGEVALESDKLKAPSGTNFTFTVGNVSLIGWIYDLASNVEISNSTTVP